MMYDAWVSGLCQPFVKRIYRVGQKSRSKPDYFCNRPNFCQLPGSAVTQTMLGGLAIYPPVANFL